MTRAQSTTEFCSTMKSTPLTHMAGINVKGIRLSE